MSSNVREYERCFRLPFFHRLSKKAKWTERGENYAGTLVGASDDDVIVGTEGNDTGGARGTTQYAPAKVTMTSRATRRRHHLRWSRR